MGTVPSYRPLAFISGLGMFACRSFSEIRNIRHDLSSYAWCQWAHLRTFKGGSEATWLGPMESLNAPRPCIEKQGYLLVVQCPSSLLFTKRTGGIRTKSGESNEASLAPLHVGSLCSLQIPAKPLFYAMCMPVPISGQHTVMVLVLGYEEVAGHLYILAVLHMTDDGTRAGEEWRSSPARH